MWVVSFPSFLMGLTSMAAVRNWASLTTNRSLLSNLMRVYVFAFFLIFIFTLWLACATLLTFKRVTDWSVSPAFDCRHTLHVGFRLILRNLSRSIAGLYEYVKTM
jgi:hypothetical protein